MDTSEQYIKMCEKAEEIQGGKPQSGDYWVDTLRGYIVLISSDYKKKRPNYFIKLFRQDQLQAMIHSTDWISTLEKFTLFTFGLKRTSPRIYYGMGIPHNVFSMEQLWLVFVMHEKYGKVWNGEEWVCQTRS